MKLAVERNEAKRAQFLIDIGQFNPEQLVFVDESSVDKRTSQRHYGWSEGGRRAEMHGHFVRGTRYVTSPL